jgi:hypothetical protein
MRGESFKGFISEGDEVEVPGRWKVGKTIKANRVQNLTTGTLVSARALKSKLGGCGQIVVALPFALLFWGAIIYILSSGEMIWALVLLPFAGGFTFAAAVGLIAILRR